MHTFSVLMSGENSPWWQSLSMAFEQNPSFRVSGFVEPDQVLQRVQALQPDILIWRPDLQEQELSVLELKTICPFVIPIAIVQDPASIDLMNLLKDGLCGCLPMRLRPWQIISAIDIMVIGGLICLPRLSPEASQQFFNGGSRIGPSLMGLLTPREQEILRLLTSNQSNQEIAQQLCLAESTVKTHLRNIFRKMGVRSRSEVLLQLHRY